MAKKRILVVDDNLHLLKVVRIGLELRGFDVATAETGKAALDEVATREPDVMLLDIRMPHVDGFDVLRQLRSISDLPVIVYSATPDCYSDALACGANAFLSKPFDLDWLVQLIEEITASPTET